MPGCVGDLRHRRIMRVEDQRISADCICCEQRTLEHQMWTGGEQCAIFAARRLRLRRIHQHDLAAWLKGDGAPFDPCGETGPTPAA
jgi:hypothetical protein